MTATLISGDLKFVVCIEPHFMASTKSSLCNFGFECNKLYVNMTKIMLVIFENNMFDTLMISGKYRTYSIFILFPTNKTVFVQLFV